VVRRKGPGESRYAIGHRGRSEGDGRLVAGGGGGANGTAVRETGALCAFATRRGGSDAPRRVYFGTANAESNCSRIGREVPQPGRA